MHAGQREPGGAVAHGESCIPRMIFLKLQQEQHQQYMASVSAFMKFTFFIGVQPSWRSLPIDVLASRFCDDCGALYCAAHCFFANVSYSLRWADEK